MAWRFDDDDVHRGGIERRGHEVVRHLGVGHGAIAHHDFLQECVADALGRSSLDLTGDQRWMNRFANVLHGREVDGPDLVGVGVHLDFRDITRPGVRRIRVSAIVIVVPPDAMRRLVLLRYHRRPVLSVMLARRHVADALAELGGAALKDAPHDHAGA
jgi:hypothetical protein